MSPTAEPRMMPSPTVLLSAGAGPGVRRSDRRPGVLVISLDLELHWGVRDLAPLDRAEQARLLSARAVVPRILSLFDQYSVHATWATVGLLLASGREQAESFMPVIRPHYQDARLDPYQQELGVDEAQDPFHFAPSLIAEIAAHPGQEIGSHSFAHYYCMEEGQSLADFEADLSGAVAIANQAGYVVQSYVFPRNQAAAAYIDLLARYGIRAYRAPQAAVAHEPQPVGEQQKSHRRLARLLDSYIKLSGHGTQTWPCAMPPTPLTASSYLRPYHPLGRHLQPLLHRRIVAGMQRAAEKGEIFHLWWHPEDFARYPDQNLEFLQRVLQSFDSLRSSYGMVSLSMAEAARLAASSESQPELQELWA